MQCWEPSLGFVCVFGSTGPTELYSAAMYSIPSEQVYEEVALRDLSMVLLLHESLFLTPSLLSQSMQNL